MGAIPELMTTVSTTRIADWTALHGLTAEEVARLESVLVDYPPDEVAAELDEELRCIFGARKLAAMPKMSTEEFLAAGRAFESGRTPFKVQDVD